MKKFPRIKADFLETGSGPLVMLIHSSVSGARMWRRLMDDLKDDFQVRAVNLSAVHRLGRATHPNLSMTRRDWWKLHCRQTRILFALWVTPSAGR
jgi:hypothetical protein